MVATARAIVGGIRAGMWMRLDSGHADVLRSIWNIFFEYSKVFVQIWKKAIDEYRRWIKSTFLL